MRAKLSMLAMAVAMATTLNVQAGTPCEPAAADPQHATRAFTMAETTRAKLASLGDDVVLIARAGQDLRKYNLTYSHMGFAVRQADGSWGLVHKLNECGTAHSSLYDEGLANFYSDSPFRYQAGIWRLEPAVQAKLKRALLSKKANDYHEQAYNMLAYPFSTRYQNSNGWVLELLAWSLAPEDEANTRSSAQTWLKQAGYVPSTLELGALTRLGARVTKANVAFDDHPGEMRWSGHIQTVTVDSMVSWLRTRPDACLEKGCPEIRLKLDDDTP